VFPTIGPGQQNYKMTLRMSPKAVISNMMIDGIARRQ
jgi:hypothetical protein